MPDQPIEKVILPKNPVLPDGFWSMPGGAAGLRGSVEGVTKAIDELADVPAHSKTALKEQLASHLDGTDHNFVVIHAHAVCRDDDSGYHSIVNFEISSSKSL